eukprot:COSAG01_NODE_1876_length_8997_cov_11.629355_7_plen_221_part_00
MTSPRNVCPCTVTYILGVVRSLQPCTVPYEKTKSGRGHPSRSGLSLCTASTVLDKRCLIQAHTRVPLSSGCCRAAPCLLAWRRLRRASASRWRCTCRGSMLAENHLCHSCSDQERLRVDPDPAPGERWRGCASPPPRAASGWSGCPPPPARAAPPRSAPPTPTPPRSLHRPWPAAAAGAAPAPAPAPSIFLDTNRCDIGESQPKWNRIVDGNARPTSSRA